MHSPLLHQVSSLRDSLARVDQYGPPSRSAGQTAYSLHPRAPSGAIPLSSLMGSSAGSGTLLASTLLDIPSSSSLHASAAEPASNSLTKSEQDLAQYLATTNQAEHGDHGLSREPTLMATLSGDWSTQLDFYDRAAYMAWNEGTEAPVSDNHSSSSQTRSSDSASGSEIFRPFNSRGEYVLESSYLVARRASETWSASSRSSSDSQHRHSALPYALHSSVLHTEGNSGPVRYQASNMNRSPFAETRSLPSSPHVTPQLEMAYPDGGHMFVSMADLTGPPHQDLPTVAQPIMRRTTRPPPQVLELSGSAPKRKAEEEEEADLEAKHRCLPKRGRLNQARRRRNAGSAAEALRVVTELATGNGTESISTFSASPRVDAASFSSSNFAHQSDVSALPAQYFTHDSISDFSLSFPSMMGISEPTHIAADRPAQCNNRRRPASMPLPVPVPNLIKKSRGRHVPAVPDINAPPRSFICQVVGCGKSFVRGEHLKRHVRSIHTYDRPWICPSEGCGKTFSRRDNLAQHARVHLPLS
ncbi:unnamed protein product [Mycena citricolor]|uniref:C2H2-type domain-containing protein n=1 Tax=Mycena citricolor TaxID=2018698 RepID=A0AAD2Q778_9AGAR|nr:unnamed protein product [Mycena citricolor]CAK5283668.1 unnamed protein product [Mycena citricolor]CAK5283751.1 unnamed protein product [Mycena citricolor]